MINKDFRNSFAEKIKETANKEQEHKQKIIDILMDIADLLEKLTIRVDDIDNKLYNKDRF